MNDNMQLCFQSTIMSRKSDRLSKSSAARSAGLITPQDEEEASKEAIISESDDEMPAKKKSKSVLKVIVSIL